MVLDFILNLLSNFRFIDIILSILNVAKYALKYYIEAVVYFLVSTNTRRSKYSNYIIKGHGKER